MLLKKPIRWWHVYRREKPVPLRHGDTTNSPKWCASWHILTYVDTTCYYVYLVSGTLEGGIFNKKKYTEYTMEMPFYYMLWNIWIMSDLIHDLKKELCLWEQQVREYTARWGVIHPRRRRSILWSQQDRQHMCSDYSIWGEWAFHPVKWLHFDFIK